MKQNIGNADRIARFILGIVILGVGYYFGSWFGLIGIVPIFTALIRVCPAYLPFGISTCELKKKD